MIELKRTCETCRYIDIIGNIGKEILTQFDFSKIIYSCYSQINTIVNAPLFAIGICNPNKNELELFGLQNQSNKIIKGNLPISDTNIWAIRCFINTEEIIFNNLNDGKNMYFSKILFKDDDSTRKSFLYLPLIYNGETKGILSLQSFTENAFNTEQINLIRIISNYVCIALENTNYFNEIEYQKNQLAAIIENMEAIISTRTYEIEQQKLLLEHQSELLYASNKELSFLSIVAKKTENAIMIMDEFGNIIWINDFFTKIYGYTLIEFIKIRGGNILQTSFNSKIEGILTECVETKKAVSYQALNIKQDGKAIWTQTSLTPILDASEKITHLVTIDSDITNIKLAEHVIQEKSNEIIKSIEYASRIQRAAFPSKNSINEIISQNFIFWKPLDIISGDFYWIKRKRNFTFIILGDCTGHGVPGALLSMLGCSFIEDIFNSYSHENASEILEQLQELFDQRFRYWVMGADVYDGMDVAICILNEETHTLHFAGANQDLIIIQNNEIIQVNGNRRSIGKQLYETNQPFINHTFPIIENQLFYLFSDGFSSQFGGKLGKKYMKKPFINFLYSIHHLNIKEQKTRLTQELERWIGSENYQIDDISVIGFNGNL